MRDQRSRLSATAEATSKVTAATKFSVAISGRRVVDVRPFDGMLLAGGGACRAMARATDAAAPGKHLLLRVADRQWPDPGGVDYLRRHGGHLGGITIDAPSDYTMHMWANALRYGVIEAPKW